MSGSDTETSNLFDCALREGLMLSGHTALAGRKKIINVGLKKCISHEHMDGSKK